MSYADPVATVDLLAAGRAARRVRLAAADMVSIAEAARLACVSPSTIRRWSRGGRCIRLHEPGVGHRLPRWQFVEPMWGMIASLSAAVGSVDGWELLAFLETPLGAFEGRTARAAIEQGESARVLAVACRAD
jgi:hypothetical protein